MDTLWTADAVATATVGTVGGEPAAATGVSIDTRTLKPGDIFVALVGEAGRDGHTHAEDAMRRGAAFVLAHNPLDVPHVLVADTLAGLTALGVAGRARAAARVVAVTGSVGKTTTKEMLRTILSADAPTHAAAASYNNHWGVPLTLARMPPDAVYAVIEIGMNHPGEIAPLARLARPDVAVITGIERVHIGHLGSIEAIATEKAALLDGLDPSGVAVLPADSPLLPLLLGHVADHFVRRFGTHETADARLLDLTPDADGSVVEAAFDGRRIRFRLGAPGRHMAFNALAALLAAEAVGVPPARASEALETFDAIAGRGARRTIILPSGGAALLLDESYNASSASVRAALGVLALQPATRRVIVLGDMLELGDDTASEHAGLAPDVAAVLRQGDVLFACGPAMRHLVAALPDASGAVHATDSDALAPLVAAALRPGDVVLVKGSLGSRMRRVIDAVQGVG
jgi:UDP-N-acetylmuramoyl-tripeptide--D-alanyl-D-alanine ligase